MSRDALTHAIREAFSYDACLCRHCTRGKGEPERRRHHIRKGRRRLARELRNEAADAAGEGE
jgi:hypothetical protein